MRSRATPVTVHADRKEASAAERPLGVTEAYVHEVAVAVNCPLEVWPFALRLEIRLIHISTLAHRPAPSFAQGGAQQEGQLRLPVPHGFMREVDPLLQKHLGQIAQTQLVAKALGQPDKRHRSDMRGN